MLFRSLITRVDFTNGACQTAELSSALYHLAYIKNLNKFYVSSRKEAKIWVFDPMTLVVENTIDLEQGVTHQMVIRDE